VHKPAAMSAPWRSGYLRATSQRIFGSAGTRPGLAVTNNQLAANSNTNPACGHITHAPPEADCMPPKRQLVAVIDDDPSVLKALDRQVSAAGYRSHAFASAEEFLAVAAFCGAACVVCDIHLGGMSGLQLAVHPVVTSLNLPVV